MIRIRPLNDIHGNENEVREGERENLIQGTREKKGTEFVTRTFKGRSSSLHPTIIMKTGERKNRERKDDEKMLIRRMRRK